MKRSEINAAIIRAKKRFDEYKISLPCFAYWSAEEWNKNRDITTLIRERMLGWDVSDFGSGDFKTMGAVLFTVRNGDKNDTENKAPYAEKYILLDDEVPQALPFHYHIQKAEDIINRGGGVLVVEMYNKAEDGKEDRENDVTVYQDGIKHTYKPGEPIYITPGNSITIEPYMYHRFYAEKGKGFLICGEVSKVNDDNCDNIYLYPQERFSQIEEDEAIVHPLVNEYDNI